MMTLLLQSATTWIQIQIQIIPQVTLVATLHFDKFIMVKQFNAGQ